MKSSSMAATLTSWGCVGCEDKCLVITESKDIPVICPYGKAAKFIKQVRRK